MTITNATVQSVRLPHPPHPAAMVVAERLRKASQAGHDITGLTGTFVTRDGTELFSLRIADGEIDLRAPSTAGTPRLRLAGSIAGGDLAVQGGDEGGRALLDLINSPTDSWVSLAEEWWGRYASARFMPAGVRLVAADSNQRVDLGIGAHLSVTAATPHLLQLFTSCSLLALLMAGSATTEGPYPFIVAVNRALIDYHLGGNW